MVLSELFDEQVQVALEDWLIGDTAVGEKLAFLKTEQLDGAVSKQGLSLGHETQVYVVEGLADVGVFEEPQLANGLGFGLKDNFEKFARHRSDLALVAEDDDLEESAEVGAQGLGGEVDELILIQILQLAQFEGLVDEADEVFGAVVQGTLDAEAFGLGVCAAGSGFLCQLCMIR